MKKHLRHPMPGVALLLLGAVVGLSPVVAAPIEVAAIQRNEPVDFAKEIYPLLKKNCLACHNTTKAKANLNLESPQDMLKGGDTGPAIVAGKSTESLLLKSAAHLDEDLVMPPPGNKVNAVSLSPQELGLLKLWIDQGGKGEAITDAKGALPWRAVASGPVQAVALSPDSRLVAAARGNRVELGELATGRVLAMLGDPELAKLEPWRGQAVADRDAVMSVAFANDELLATGGFREVRLWRRQPRTVKREFGKLAEPATALAVSNDGQWAVAGDAKGNAWLFAIRAEKFEPLALKDGDVAISALAFAPDGAALITCSEDKSVRVWSLVEKKVIFKGALPDIARSLVHLGNEIAVGCQDGVVRIWPWLPEPPAELPKPVREWKVGDQPVAGLSPGFAAKDAGMSLLAASGGALQLLDATGKEIQKVSREHPAARRVSAAEQTSSAAQALAATRKKQLNAIVEKVKKEQETAKKAVEAWAKAEVDLRSKREEAEAAAEALRQAPGEKAAQDLAKKTADALTKSETAWRAAKVNLELGSRAGGGAAQDQAVAELALAAAEAAQANAQAGLEVAKKLAAEPWPAVRQVALWRPSGEKTDESLSTAIVVESDGRFSHVNLKNGALLEPPDRAGLIAVLPPDGELLCIGADKSLRLTSPRRTWTLERVIGQADNPALLADRVTALGFSPDGKLLATGGGVPSRNGELKLWRVADGSLVRQVSKAHADTINGVAFSPDGDLLASAASDRLARVWKVSDGTRVANFEGHSGHVLSVTWRADGLALATGGADQTLRTWDLAQRKLIKKTDFSAEVTAVAYAGAGETLVTTSGSQIRLGDQGLPQATGFLFSACTDSPGKLIAAGGQDGVVRVWTAGERKLLHTFGPVKP